MADHSGLFKGGAEYGTYFQLARETVEFSDRLLLQFNDRSIKLSALSPAQRIFLFILTRSIKTYSSILLLCQHGYGQDVATLLRGLLENLITARYILHDPARANALAERFVAYKWIIFKRTLPDEEKAMKGAALEKKREFYERKSMVLRNVEAFKKKFEVASDRALMTWSGKTVRDMAKTISPALLTEYDLTFRRCSRFSHPSILGDKEYMVQDGKSLVFSPLPSSFGVLLNLQSAIQHFLDFVFLVDEQFHFDEAHGITKLRSRLDALKANHSDPKIPIPSTTAGKPGDIRECAVVFDVHPD